MLAALALIALFAAVIGSAGFDSLRESAFDAMLSQRRPVHPSTVPVVVIDIDRATLAEVGPWPWSRDRLATLVATINGAKPRILGLDILIDGVDERSPAALARKLAETTGRAEFAAAADSLADGD
ncbi:MAG: CHASE2 domain-containing protein, partial [Hyphomicrobiaceae bacterium]